MDDGLRRFSSSFRLSYFHDLGPSKPDLMVVIFVGKSYGTIFIAVTQEILFEIIKVVNRHSAEFVFPSTIVYIEKNIKH